MRDKGAMQRLLLPLLLLFSVSQGVPGAGAQAKLGQAAKPRLQSLVASSSPPQDGYVYTVRAADTLWDIASAHGITVQALVAANDLADPRLLRPGQTLFIPAEPPPITASEGADVPALDTAAAARPESPTGTITETLSLPPEIAGWPSIILTLMNEKRAAQGLSPLTWSPELAQAAQAHAEDCAQRKRGSHSGSDGAILRARLARAGYAARYASENWANARSAPHAFEMWWNEQRGDDPHRRNILGPRFAEVGIGIARGGWGYYVIADFGGR